MKIETINLLNQNVLLVKFDIDWSYDDIETLSSHIFQLMPSAKIVEVITGADRQTTRFEFNCGILSLNFEAYSQSSWLEAATIDDIPVLLDIMSRLN